MSSDPDVPSETPAAVSERPGSRSARAAKVAAVQRARGNSTGPNDPPRAPKKLKRV
ncbi:MAG: hypothetical protein ACKV2O_13430 [Acidimicrobiales bacterium]